MNILKDKITMKQAVLILLCCTYSPTMRFIPYFTAKMSHQAAWLAPFISSVILLLLVLIMNSIYKKHTEASLSYMDIIHKVFGKFIGKFIISLLLIFIVIYHTYFVRVYCERLTSTTYSDVSIWVFALVMLLLVKGVLSLRVVVLGRLGEIIFIILLFIFTFLILLNIPNIDINNLTPISTDDILPVVKGSFGTTAVFILFTLIFLISDKIQNLTAIKKIGFQLTLFYTLAIPSLIIMVTGTLNYSIIQRAPIPFITALKNISILRVVEKLDSLIVATWIFSDFILLSFMTLIIIKLFKSLLNLKDEYRLVNIYLIFNFIFSLSIVTSRFELDTFSSIVIVPGVHLFCLILPLMTLIIGKIRKIT